MDKTLLDTCRYTGIKATPSKSEDASMAVCPFCSGVTRINLDNIPILEENAFRCSHCGENILRDLDFGFLETTIISANGTLANAVEGTTVGTYPVGSKATLQTAVNTAGAILTQYNPVPSQSDIDSANTTLNTAIGTFTASKKTS